MREEKRRKRGTGAPRPDRWGVAYRGTGELGEVAAATSRALGELGVLCQVSRTRDGYVSIEGETTIPWYRLLSGDHPQRARALVEPEHRRGEVRLSLDLSLLGWYRGMVLALWGAWVLGLSALFWFTDPEQFRSGGKASTVLLIGTMGVLGVVAWIPFLLRALGGGRIQAALWQPILRAVDRAGGYLEPEGPGSGRRFRLWFLSYGLSFLLFGGGALVSMALEGTRSISRGGFWVLVTLVGLATLLLGSAVAIAVWRGFGLRVEAIVLGVGSSVLVLILLATPMLLAVTGELAAEAVAAGSDRAAWWSRIVLAATLLIPALALALAAYMLSLSRHLWKPLERTYRHRGRPGIYRDAVGGGARLAGARLFFGVYALACAGLVVLAVGLSGAWAGAALALVDPVSPALRAPLLSGSLLAQAVGLPPGDPWADGLARAGWVVWAILAWGLLGLSVGQLAWKRHRLRRHLTKHRPRNVPSHRALAERAEELLRRTGARSFRLAITSGSAILAFSHRFWWPRPGRFIEVSEGALERLGPDELEALLAHELAHLRRGHVLLHDLFLWFGRVAFVGDGFCRGLLNSFDWEAVADREAARMLGDRRQALVRCLWTIAAVNPSRRDPWTRSGGLPVDAVPGGRGTEAAGGEGGVAGSRLQRLWEPIRLFLGQYTGGSELDYWHPVPDERAERILGSTCRRAPRR